MSKNSNSMPAASRYGSDASSQQHFRTQLQQSNPTQMVRGLVEDYPIAATCAALALGLIAGTMIGAALSSPTPQPTMSRWSNEWYDALKQQLGKCV